MSGRIKQAVCQWCYRATPLAELAAAAAGCGLAGIDLLGPDDWPLLNQHGLICTLTAGSGPIDKGLNRVEHHDKILDKMRTLIEQTADAGFPNVICFAGNRHVGGTLIPDDEGMDNCATAIKQVLSLAERRHVTVCMELLNSKLEHKDYMFDRTSWGVALCKRIGSPNFKILYDVYHAQIMEGDVIRTLRENLDYIGHIHTGGVPGRHEIDDTQELNYPAIIRALVDLKYQGYVAHEFIPASPDPLASMAAAARLCQACG